jgi:choline kinase
LEAHTNQIDTAVILAAGRGSRLRELSLQQPKPMTQVNNIPIIDNLLRQLLDNNFKKIVVVIGYLADKLQNHITNKFGEKTEFIFITNEIYDKTNNIYSLYLAETYIKEGFFLFEADLFCEDIIISRLIKSPQDNVILADYYTSEMNGTVITISSGKKVDAMYLKKNQGDSFNFSNTFKTLNFYKLSKDYVNSFFLKKLETHIKGQDLNSYYEQIIKESIDAGYIFSGLISSPGRWWEIDTIEDLEKAEKMFKHVQ